jgi:type IV pilus assembly protein PilP
MQKRQMRTPLEKIESRNLSLIAVMLADSGNKAILRAPDSKEYIVTEGTRIGINSGRVARILNRKIVIEEQFKNTEGLLQTLNTELSVENAQGP